MNDQQIESLIQENSKTAPRVTPDNIWPLEGYLLKQKLSEA